MSPYFFDAPVLPDGFRFPAAHQEYVAGSGEELAPWRMLAFDMASSLYYWAALRKRFPDLSLVPFAMLHDESGFANEGWVVVASFDGNDRTGLPRVLIYDYEHPRVAPNKTKGFAGFSDWLDAARHEASEFQRTKAADQE